MTADRKNHNKHLTAWMQITISFVFLGLFSPGFAQEPDIRSFGYRKDIFINDTYGLNHSAPWEAMRSLNLSFESTGLNDYHFNDVLYRRWSNFILGGSDLLSNRIHEDDTNGWLLYPDGQPRYRVIFTPGGVAGTNMSALLEDSRKAILKFFRGGGSYTGACAGAFLAQPLNYGLMDFQMYGSIYQNQNPNDWTPFYVDHGIPEGSRLAEFPYFTEGQVILDVAHVGGGYMSPNQKPEGTEILLEFSESDSMQGLPAAWMWPNDINNEVSSGRVVVTGSHPELTNSQEGEDLWKAFFELALEGQGQVVEKARLPLDGTTRVMDRYWEDNQPGFARIGDGQYHHFGLGMLEPGQEIRITLEGEPGLQYNLYLNRENYAFDAPTLHLAANKETTNQKSLTLTIDEAGEYFVSVEMATEIEPDVRMGEIAYQGDVRVLNGASYSISAALEAQDPIVLIPDVALKNHLLTLSDSNGDGEISQSEARAYHGEINLQNFDLRYIEACDFRVLYPNGPINRLDGIEAFENMSGLYIFNQPITSLAPLLDSVFARTPGNVLDLQLTFAGFSQEDCDVIHGNQWGALVSQPYYSPCAGGPLNHCK